MEEQHVETISVILAAYNEVDNIEAVVNEIQDVLTSLRVPTELLIVDDGSLDGTGEVADELQRRYQNVRVVHHGANQGLGGVYRTGLREAVGEFVTFFPADGQFPASIIANFFALIVDHELVLGYIPQRKSSIVALGLSAAERVIYRALFGRFPRFQGIFMVRRSILAEIPLVSDGRGWAVSMELILRISRGPYRVISAPNELRPRLSGQSKVNNFRNIVANLKQVLVLRTKL